MVSIWNMLPKPIFSLAPMEDVTDTVLRQIFCITGKPDVFFTEFTNVDGIQSHGHDVVARRLLFTQVEHPIVAQIWGMIPENFYKTAKDLAAKGFDGIDINMGCPQHDVTSHGACSALIKNKPLAKEIIEATKEGVRSASSGQAGELPVSVKTRIGFKEIATEEWIGFLLQQNLDVITVHGRTAAEMSKVPAHWDEIGKVVELRNSLAKHTLIFGNGDVQSIAEAKEKVEKYKVDGVMIGRGIFHNPWLFAGIDPSIKSVKERLELLQVHVKLFRDTWGNKKSFQILKKYFKVYLSDFEGAVDMRMKFMETNSYEEALSLATSLLPSS
ncbi:MAG TPA: tRNA-dihydrouridine synthase [Candidatus Eisenbacteria bacterium]|nr:tRNA-dihydrouridine synthase [Candidatus Eisenbacteria bacterium]